MYIKRNIENIIKKRLFDGKVIILYGPRQSGKTTLIKRIVSEYGDSMRFLDCELIDNKNLLDFRSSQQLFSLVEKYKIVVFDEAQVIPNIGSILKSLYDHHPEVQYIATGSSSFDLANKVSEPLTGRSFEFILYPLLLTEMTDNAFDAEQYLYSLMRFGGYPELNSLNEEEKISRIQTLASQYLYKDVLSIGGVKKPDVITQLLRLLAFQIGHEVSYRELASQLQVSQPTVERYIDLLEKNFVIVRLGSYSRNLRNEVMRSKKIYFVDLGMRNALIGAFQTINSISRNDIGGLFENCLIMERFKHMASMGLHRPNAYFWRTFAQQEIDYIEEQGEYLSAIEFKWNNEKSSTVPSAFSEGYPSAKFSVVTPRSAFAFITGAKSP